MIRRANWFYSILPSWLPLLQRHTRYRLVRIAYRILYSWYENASHPIRSHIHGFSVLLNPGNTYPFIISNCPLFNAPLVELVHQTWLSKGDAITFIDVGAAVGDTVLLLKQRCPRVVGKFFCVEGDAEFHTLLVENMRQFSDVQVIKALLARETTKIRSLVKHHKGTAAALGEESDDAVRLDSLQKLVESNIDVLKVDVDGFDGEVLAGSTLILQASKPAVIFEWHPMLLRRTGNDPQRAFSALNDAGYDRFLWFNNLGTFSHFSESVLLNCSKHTRPICEV